MTRKYYGVEVKCNEVANIHMYEVNSPLLTPKQRRALTEDFEILDESERTRFRNRIIRILLDFAVLNEHIPDDQRRKIFAKALKGDLRQDLSDDSQSTALMYGLAGIQEFLWSGLRENDWKVEQHEGLLEEAIISSEEEGVMPLKNQSYLEVKVDVDIDIKRTYHHSLEEVRSKFRAGYDLPGADFKRALGPIPRDELIELLDQYAE